MGKAGSQDRMGPMVTESGGPIWPSLYGPLTKDFAGKVWARDWNRKNSGLAFLAACRGKEPGTKSSRDQPAYLKPNGLNLSHGRTGTDYFGWFRGVPFRVCLEPA